MAESYRHAATTSHDKNPLVYIGSTLGLIFLIWFYFYVQVPYSTIPDTTVFWASFIAWALMPIVFAWRYGRSGSSAGFKFMILVRAMALFFGAGCRLLPFLSSPGLAALP